MDSISGAAFTFGAFLMVAGGAELVGGAYVGNATVATVGEVCAGIGFAVILVTLIAVNSAG